MPARGRIAPGPHSRQPLRESGNWFVRLPAVTFAMAKVRSAHAAEGWPDEALSAFFAALSRKIALPGADLT